MNKKTIFKKPRVIITAVVLTLIVALTAVVVILAQEPATFKGVQVAADGYINLRFHYTINDESVTKANVYIYDGDQGYLNHGEPVVVDLVTDDKGNTYFSVPLAAAQMGCDVTVVPLDENGTQIKEATATSSVKKYADKVLADDSYSDELRAGLKAIMNYGHYASEYFAVGNHVVENEGIYGRKTNPIIGMTKLLKSGEGPTWEVDPAYADVLEIEKITVALEDSVSIKVYYTYTGDSSTTGTLIEGNKYYVSIDNIGANQYTTDYSANLKIQVGAYTAATIKNASVIKCLEKMVGEESTKDLALALYNFYHWTSEATKTARQPEGCQHFMHYEYVADGVTQPVCTYCGMTVNYQVSDEINYFSAPGQFVNSYNSNTVDDGTYLATGTIMPEYSVDSDGIIYTRVYWGNWGSVFLANGTAISGYGSYNGDNTRPYILDQVNVDENGNTQGAGRYLVIKMRTSEKAKSIQLQVVTSSNPTGESMLHTRWIGQGASEMPTADYSRFITYVVDLGAYADVDSTAINIRVGNIGTDNPDEYTDIAYSALCDNWSEVESVVGQGETVHYLGAWSAMGTNEKGEPARVNTSGTNWLSNGCCVSGCTARVVEGDKDYSVATDTVCYQTTITTYKCSNASCQNYNVSTSALATFDHKVFSGTPTVANKTYSYSCSTCDRTMATVSAPQDISYFSAPGYVYNVWAATVKPTTSAGMGPGANQDGNSVTGLLSTVGYDNGVVYTRINAHNSTTVILADETYSSANNGKYSQDSTAFEALGEQGLGQYVVIKLRTNNLIKGNVRMHLRWRTAEATSTTTIIGDSLKGGLTTTNGEFITYVFKITPVPTADFVGVSLGTDFGKGFNDGMYIDVAYFALCYNEAQLWSVVGNENNVVYTPSWGTSATADTNVDHSKQHTCDTTIKYKGTVNDSDGTTKYVYGCDNYTCGTTLTKPEGVNFYSAPGQAINNWNSANADGTALSDKRLPLTNIISDKDGVYTRIMMYSYGGAFFTNETVASPSSSTHYEKTKAPEKLTGGLGQYMVVKMRTVGISCSNVRIQITKKVGDAVSYVMSYTGHTGMANTAFNVYVFEITPDANASHTQVIIGANGDGKGGYIDVAYVANCDTWAEVAKVVGDETVYYSTKWGATETVTNSDGSCYCVYGQPTINGNEYVYTCSKCKNSTYTLVVPEGVNYYSAPGQLVNNWAAGDNSNSVSSDKKVLLNNVVSDDKDGVYSRVYVGNGASIFLGNGTIGAGSYVQGAANDTITSGQGIGKYMVLKVRTNGTKAFRFGYVSSGGKGTSISWSKNWRASASEFYDSEFTTYVIQVTEDKSATKVGVILGTGRSVYTDSEGTNLEHYVAGESIDIAYFAICDNWTEVASVVGNDDVLLTTWKNGNESSNNVFLYNVTPTEKAMTNAEVLAEAAKEQ